MKTPLTAFWTLVAAGAGSGLVACSAGDSPEAITQAEAELVAEQQAAQSKTDTDTSSKSARKGRRGHRHHHGPKDPAKMIERFDENDDGVLDVAELPPRKQKWLADADTDQNGQLSVEELAAHFEARHARRFAKKDENGDGFLTEEELGEHRYKHLIAADADGDGRLTADEITQAFENGTLRHRGKHHGRFGRRGFHGPPSPEKFIERFDDNDNGSLEPDELPGRMGKKMTKADANGDGSLSLEELKAGMRERGKKFFAKKDDNGDGFLTEDEVGGRRWEFISAADANGDAKVTFEELEQAFESGALKPHGFGKHGKKGRGEHGQR